MADVEIKVLKRLPPSRSSMLDDDHRADLLVTASNVMAEVYARHFGLTRLAGRMRVSLYHLQAVTYRDEQGIEHEAIGAAIGPSGGTPIATVLLPLDEPVQAFICLEAEGWIATLGGGELPNKQEEIDLDRI